jgi:transcriptional regulator with XRE-family HTH domain
MNIVRTEALAQVIRDRLVVTGKNAKEICAVAGISPSHLTRFLQGTKAISRSKLLSLASQLGVSHGKMLFAAGVPFEAHAEFPSNPRLDLEQVYCNASIFAVLQAYVHLMDNTVHVALEKTRYGKKDTLGLDGVTESRIAETIIDFDKDAVLITEEIGKSGNAFRSHVESNRAMPTTLFVADPTDRSKQLEEFLGPDKDHSQKKVLERLKRDNAIQEWEARFGEPASITGASSAVTCIIRGVPTCAAIVNFITHELFVASRLGVFVLPLTPFGEFNPSNVTLDFVTQMGRRIYFRTFGGDHTALQNMRHFTTFLGSEEKKGYDENLFDSNLLPDKASAEANIIYRLPGGPLRILYLSTIQPLTTPVGFILANGEKLGEWIHWLPFLRFGKSEGREQTSDPALNIYELYQERPWVKEGVLMATAPSYSIFTSDRNNPGRMLINIEKFKDFENPSLVRAMLLMTPPTNTWASDVAKRNVFRKMVF